MTTSIHLRICGTRQEGFLVGGVRRKGTFGEQTYFTRISPKCQGQNNKSLGNRFAEVFTTAGRPYAEVSRFSVAPQRLLPETCLNLDSKKKNSRCWTAVLECDTAVSCRIVRCTGVEVCWSSICLRRCSGTVRRAMMVIVLALVVMVAVVLGTVAIVAFALTVVTVTVGCAFAVVFAAAIVVAGLTILGL